MFKMKIVEDPKWNPLKFVEGFGEKQRKESFQNEILEFGDNVFTKSSISDQDQVDDFTIFKFIDLFVFVNKQIETSFRNKFKFHMKDDEIFYDNLINLCIMVKNAGEEFRDMLSKNLKYIDRWTILDTGSTDNTVSIINEVLGEVPGNLYQEPFINFRDSRNRLLDLAGSFCAFNIMLDDTYVLKGEVREFLSIVRSDFVTDCFSVSVEDVDTLYNSCRITRPYKPTPSGEMVKLNLRYVNIIHEIIETDGKVNVAIPYKNFSISDVSSPYMENRTRERKRQDIKLLEQVLEENPYDTRSYYYIADSYILLKEYDKALKYFKIRADKRYEGYSAEVQDSLYYIAVISNIFMGVEWEKCHEMYLDCYNFDPRRPDSLYLIGKHYIDDGKENVGLLYLEKAFELGVPETTMSMRKNMYGYHIPYELISPCYNLHRYELGEKCCRKLVDFIKTTGYKEDRYTIVNGWLEIFYLFNKYNQYQKSDTVFNGRTNTKTIVFVSPGGWSEWDGETLYTKGLGGSETFTVKYGETLAEMGYQVIVFCNCLQQIIHKNVHYIPIEKYIEFLCGYRIDVCLINRYPSYIHTTILKAKRTYFISHDLTSEDTLIPTSANLTGLLFLSEFQKRQFLSLYSMFEDRCSLISYGIDSSLFPESELSSIKDIENAHWTNPDNEINFIYPSFPNRGLLPLLEIFPTILTRFPNAKLHIFCEMKQYWVQKYHKEVIDKIEDILDKGNPNIINHGWVNGEELRKFWKKAHVWLYPCTFEETFCMTALESAMSKTLIICSNTGALPETVGDRGLIIPGNPSEVGWKIFAVNRLFNILEGHEDKKDLIENTYRWAKNKDYSIVVEDFRQKYIEN